MKKKFLILFSAIAVLLSAILCGCDIVVEEYYYETEETSEIYTTAETTEQTTVTEETTIEETTTETEPEKEYVEYSFRSEKLYNSHFEKHGAEFGEITKEEYLKKANDLINSDSESVLTKMSKDGDYLFYDESTNEFLVLSQDGYIRTFFKPNAGIDYYNRQ